MWIHGGEIRFNNMFNYCFTQYQCGQLDESTNDQDQ